jgi:hypothetical protein
MLITKQDEATAALDLNLTKFKSRILNVSASTSNPTKRNATTIINRVGTSASPQPEGQNGYAGSPVSHGSPHSTPAPRVSREDIAARTVALMNIPDTVNDARIRALVEPFGTLVKIILRPDHQGAIVEFAEPSSVGRACLGIEGHEIAPGRKISLGTVGQMMKQKADYHKDRLPAEGEGKKKKEEKAVEAIKSAFPAPQVVRRPGNQPRRGGRGGLGLKNSGVGLGGTRADLSGLTASKDTEGNGMDVDDKREGTGGGEEVKKGAKSNEDFRKLFVKD